jgi:hypothetical protein
MGKVIVHQTENGGVAVITPVLECGLTIDQIAAKDVPTGYRYKIIDAVDIPEDRSQRNIWTVDAAELTDGVGAE